MIDYRVYLVTDDPSRYAGDWLENVVAAVEGGVTCVQYRDTESAPDVQYARIRRLQDALAPRRTPLVVNNDAELAAAVHADGVHVGQHDLAPEAVRRTVGPTCEIGFSVTDLSQVADAAARLTTGVVDCLGIGPVYDATKTKADAAHEMGLAGLRAIVSRVPEAPNVAIGGVTPERAAGLLSAGAKGLAIVSAFSRSDDPFAVARQFRAAFAR